MLNQSINTKQYFAYTVELKLKEGEIYGSVAFEMPTSEVWLTKEYGVIGIDTNASPLHLAIAEVSVDGSFISYQYKLTRTYWIAKEQKRQSGVANSSSSS